MATHLQLSASAHPAADHGIVLQQCMNYLSATAEVMTGVHYRFADERHW